MSMGPNIDFSLKVFPESGDTAFIIEQDGSSFDILISALMPNSKQPKLIMRASADQILELSYVLCDILERQIDA